MDQRPSEARVNFARCRCYSLEYRYTVTILKAEALEMIRRLEAEIDKLQDKLNQYNASTRTELTQAVLDLAR